MANGSQYLFRRNVSGVFGVAYQASGAAWLLLCLSVISSAMAEAWLASIAIQCSKKLIHLYKCARRNA